MSSFYSNVKQLVFSPIVHLLCRFEIKGEENLPEGGNYIAACNHFGWLDPIVLSVYLPVQVSFAAKAELFKIPVFKKLMVLTEQIPLERERAGEPKVFKKLFEQAKSRMDDGLIFGLFPEGDRSRDGRLHEFRRGVGVIALMAKRPIVPMGLAYSRRGLRLTVRIVIGSPMESAGYRSHELTAELRRRIAECSGQRLVEDSMF